MKKGKRYATAHPRTGASLLQPKPELGTEKASRPLYMSVNAIRMEPAGGDSLPALPYPKEKEFEKFSIPIIK